MKILQVENGKWIARNDLGFLLYRDTKEEVKRDLDIAIRLWPQLLESSKTLLLAYKLGRERGKVEGDSYWMYDEIHNVFANAKDYVPLFHFYDAGWQAGWVSENSIHA